MKKEIKKKLNELVNKYKIKQMVKIDETPHFISVESYSVELENGQKIMREKLLKNGRGGSSCAVLPVLENGDLVFACEPRVFTKRGVAFNIPAGYIEEDENAKDCAVRELREETGLVCGEIKHISKYYQDTGNSSAICNVFLATNCKKEFEQQLDKDEYISIFVCSISDAVEMVEQEYIVDASSILAIMNYAILKGVFNG